jgi:hypothetical protein
MADDYLTIDEVAAQLALPVQMIQRRIESGDIPVHWVEIGGKLEMRISADEIGVEASNRLPTPFPTPEGFGGGEAGADPDDESAPSAWSVRESDYPADVWTPVEGDPPAAASPPAPTLWEAAAEDDLPASTVDQAAEPLWRPDPGTWDDEPIDAEAASEPTPEPSPISPPTADQYFPLTEAPADFAAPPLPPATGPFTSATVSPDEETAETPADFPALPLPAATGPFAVAPESADDFEEPPADFPELPLPAAADPFTAGPESADDDEEEAPFGSDEADDDDLVAVEEGLDLESPLPSEVMGVPEMVEAPRPSALAAAQGPESALAINSIDARELVSGLFERWERALEQRIQAEQRLRFEAELERRLRQVRDLRQELENTRKSTAAQLAEREQEVMALRDRLREQGPGPAQKSRGLFRR